VAALKETPCLTYLSLLRVCSFGLICYCWL
jgi:hypothetical protein